MKFRICLIIALTFLATGRLISQDASYWPGYQTIVMDNPGITGCSIEGIVRISYLNFFPGNHYNFHSGYISYDSYFPAIHGGAGIYLSDDYAGIMNETRAGISYAYFLQAGRDLYLYGGLSASLFRRGFDFNDAVLPDQIDATGSISFPSAENLADANRTVFDVGTGFMVIYGRYTGGFAITHLAQPDLAGNGSSADRLMRKYVLHFMADFDLDRQTGIKIRPLGSLLIQGTGITGFTGAILEINSIGISSGIMAGNNRNIDMQAGISFRKNWLSFFYNYRINVISKNPMMPFSLIHQTGLTLSLNNLANVKKRINFRTINMPLL